MASNSKKKKIALVLQAYDRTSKPLRRMSMRFERAIKPLSRMNHEFKKAQKALDPISKRFDNLSKSMAKFGKVGTAAVTAPVSLAAGATVKIAADFEQSMYRVQAITKATGDKLDQIRHKSEHIGATTQFTQVDAAEGMKYLTMSGMKTDVALQSIEPTVHLTGAARMVENLELPQSADIFSNIMTSFGYGKNPQDAGMVGDKLAYAFSNSNQTLSDLGQVAKMAGGISKSAGVSLDQFLAMSMTLSRRGVKEGNAGTAIAGGISRLLKLRKDTVKTLTKLKIPKSAFSKDGKLKNIIDFFRLLDSRGANTEDYMRIFGQDAGKYIVALRGHFDELNQDLNNISKKWKWTARNLNNANLMGFWGKWTLFTSSLQATSKKISEDSGLLSFSTRFLESLKRLSDSIGKLDQGSIKALTWLSIGAATIPTLTLALAGLAKGISIFFATLLPLAWTVTWPIALAGAAFGFVWWLVKNENKIKQVFDNVGDYIKGMLKKIVEYFADYQPFKITGLDWKPLEFLNPASEWIAEHYSKMSEFFENGVEAQRMHHQKQRDWKNSVANSQIEMEAYNSWKRNSYWANLLNPDWQLPGNRVETPWASIPDFAEPFQSGEYRPDLQFHMEKPDELKGYSILDFLRSVKEGIERDFNRSKDETEVTVKFENAPLSMNASPTKTGNAKVNLDIGYAMNG